MRLRVDHAPFGTYRPGFADRFIMRVTNLLPPSWLGLRLAILLRRLTTSRLAEEGLDVEQFGLRLRLYPVGNACEKLALFTPQFFEPLERQVCARLAAQAAAAGRGFSIVDIGANVGLFALIAASLAKSGGRVLAIEPQPGISDRLAYNLSLNPGLDIRPLKIAISDREGEVDLFLDPNERGASRIGGRGFGESVKVRGRKLADVLMEEGFQRAELMKIDISGSEDVAIAPYLAEASEDSLPRAILIKDSSALWTQDLFALLIQRGYRQGERSRKNIFFYRDKPRAD